MKSKQLLNRSFAAIAAVVAVASSPLCAETLTAPPSSTWSASASAGLTITRGNSHTVLGNIGFDATDKWDKNELLLKASLTYGETGKKETTEAADANAQFNRLFTERLYGGLKLDVFHDGIADINYRVTVAPLAGYYFIKETKTSLSGEFGPAFIYADQGDNANNTRTGYFTLRLAERFDYKLSDTAKVWQTIEFLPQVDDFNNYLVNFELGAEASLTKKLSLRTVLQDNYNNKPAAGRQKNDVRLIGGVAYKF